MPLNPRERANNVFGTTTDNPLSAGSTSFNSAGLINLPVIALKHATITLDPLRQFGNPEIVIVTVHTAAATVVTVTRGAYGTTPREHPQGTLWVHAPLDEDFIEIVTSLTRPSDPYEGQFIFETDTNKLVGYGGTDWAPRDAGGTIGYTQLDDPDQTGITTLVDLTNLTTTVTVGTGRRIRITGFCPQFLRTAGTVTFVNLHIREGGTSLALVTLGMNNTYMGGTVSRVLSPTAGSHSYKLSAETDGTVSLGIDATFPAYILVEDIGAV